MRNSSILNIKCELFSPKKQRYVIFPWHATAPGFTATRALHACLRCDERYPLALNPKNSNANCLTNPLWKQGKSWKTLTKILLLTHCYSDCLYKITAGIFATNYFHHESSLPL